MTHDIWYNYIQDIPTEDEYKQETHNIIQRTTKKLAYIDTLMVVVSCTIIYFFMKLLESL